MFRLRRSKPLGTPCGDAMVLESDDGLGPLFRQVHVVLRNRWHCLLEDVRKLASALRDPGHEEEEGPAEENGYPDDLRRNPRTGSTTSLHAQPLGKPRY